MATRNFASLKNASKYFVLLPQNDWDIDDFKINFKESFEKK